MIKIKRDKHKQCALFD